MDKVFSQDKTDEVSKEIHMLKSDPKKRFSNSYIDLVSNHLRVFADVSFATDHDLTSHVCFLVVLVDKLNNEHVLELCSKKAKIVVPSIAGVEIYAFVEAFDAAFSIAKNIEVIQKNTI